MGSANVHWSLPLTRLNPWYPGQYGVPGAWTDTGERQHCTGTIFYVDPNNTDANDNRDGTDPTSPLATVAQALTLCQAYRGDVIAIMANNNWIYGNAGAGYATQVSENVTVSTPGVRIVGVSQSGAVGVYWHSATAGGTCIAVRATDTLIEGIAFIGEGTSEIGINATWDSTNSLYGDLLTVRNCFFQEDLDDAIQLDYSWYADIHHNVFDTCAAYGIRSMNVTGTTAYGHFHHNYFFDITTSAISMTSAVGCHVYENTIYENNAARGLAGTPANCMIDFTGGLRNTVHHNTLSCVLPAAVNWDYDNTCTAGAQAAWMSNWLMDGPSVTNPT